MSVTPSLVSGTKVVLDAGSPVIAISAAIFGPAALASFDQPAVSRIFTNVIAPLSLIAPAASSNSGASCVQATRIGSPVPATLRKRSSSARQSWRPSTITTSLQARRTASPLSGTLSSQEQIRMLRGRSAIRLTFPLSFTSLARVSTAKGPLIASLSHLIPAAAGLGLGTPCGYNYRYSKEKITARNNAAGHAGKRASRGTDVAAAVHAGAPARIGRRLRACGVDRGRAGRRHAGLCRALRSCRIRGGAGAGRAAGASAARVLRRHGGAGRCTHSARAAGNRHHHRLARFDCGQSRRRGRRPSGLAEGHARE